jgi:hypothetical protein
MTMTITNMPVNAMQTSMKEMQGRRAACQWHACYFFLWLHFHHKASKTRIRIEAVCYLGHCKNEFCWIPTIDFLNPFGWPLSGYTKRVKASCTWPPSGVILGKVVGALQQAETAERVDCREEVMEEEVRVEPDAVVMPVEVRDLESVSVLSMVWGVCSESVESWLLGWRCRPAVYRNWSEKSWGVKSLLVFMVEESLLCILNWT